MVSWGLSCVGVALVLGALYWLINFFASLKKGYFIYFLWVILSGAATIISAHEILLASRMRETDVVLLLLSVVNTMLALDRAVKAIQKRVKR